MIQGRSGKRFGRGFSREELQKAGSTLGEAVKLGVGVDYKRKTVHEENIEIAKTLVMERKQTRKPKRVQRKD
jgi:ribosomal protein L13E